MMSSQGHSNQGGSAPTRWATPDSATRFEKRWCGSCFGNQWWMKLIMTSCRDVAGMMVYLSIYKYIYIYMYMFCIYIYIYICVCVCVTYVYILYTHGIHPKWLNFRLFSAYQIHGDLCHRQFSAITFNQIHGILTKWDILAMVPSC